MSEVVSALVHSTGKEERALEFFLALAVMILHFCGFIGTVYLPHANCYKFMWRATGNQCVQHSRMYQYTCLAFREGALQLCRIYPQIKLI